MVYIVKDQEDFSGKLSAAGDKLVVVDFFATWCGPCKMIAPKLEEFSVTYGDKVLILKVDVDECEQLAVEYEIASMPTFVFLRGSAVVEKFVGANPEKLQKTIEKHLNA